MKRYIIEGFNKDGIRVGQYLIQQKSGPHFFHDGSSRTRRKAKKELAEVGAVRFQLSSAA